MIKITGVDSCLYFFHQTFNIITSFKQFQLPWIMKCKNAYINKPIPKKCYLQTRDKMSLCLSNHQKHLFSRYTKYSCVFWTSEKNHCPDKADIIAFPAFPAFTPYRWYIGHELSTLYTYDMLPHAPNILVHEEARDMPAYY